MWLLFAFGSALFAGVTSILAKVGVKSVNADIVTALRTVVVALFAWMMVFMAGSKMTLFEIPPHSLLFLLLSGLSTGASWLCYYRALQLGDVNKITPIDKSSTVLSMLFAFIILGERPTLPKLVGMLLIAAGTLLMVVKKSGEQKTGSRGWVAYALGSAVFAAMTAILGKLGVHGVDSDLAVAVRTMVVLVMAWGIVFLQRKAREIKSIDRKSWLFITLSGFSTGASWICFFRALQLGEASVVVPIDKLSILVTIAFSYLFLKEKLLLPALLGLLLLTAGTFALIIP